MTSHWHNGQTIAQRLRVRGSGLDPTSTRLRVANLLQAVDMHPDGLAPSAILCVRTLRDPLPGKLQLRDGGYAMQPPGEWKRAVASSLNQLAAEAARPARGAVPANAGAVIFADHAEVLACLASDWCKGIIGTRWWWQSLFSSFDLVPSIVPVWQARPAYIPGALQHLAEREEVIHFVRRLEAGDAYILVQALTETFALPALRSALNTSIAEEVTAMPLPATAADPAPWLSWVPEAAEAGLHREQQSLLGLGLMLRRAPMHVRTGTFVDAVQQWHRQSLTSSPSGPPSLAGQIGSALLDPSETADEVSLHEGYVETSYGGIFYLLNLAISLDLYSDFTRPLTPGIPLNIWDFVALLGLSLLGEPLCHDPVWWLLAHLAGRDAQEPPGKDFVPPEVWRVPREWLSAFPEQTGWRWWVERERLCICHPAGFIVLDLPLVQHDPQEQLAQEMRGYARYGSPVASEEKPLTQSRADYPASRVLPHVKRWLNWLMPYVRARLRRALGLASIDELPSLLCRHGASVRVTATHLDIFLSLQELPIAIRLSGLDRDPWWIPAAGRFVAFHFR